MNLTSLIARFRSKYKIKIYAEGMSSKIFRMLTIFENCSYIDSVQSLPPLIKHISGEYSILYIILSRVRVKH